MRMAVYHDGSVVVTIPRGVDGSMAERFIRKKARWLISKLAFFKQFSDGLNRPVVRRSHRDYLMHKESARVLVHGKIEHMARVHGYRYNAVRIKNQKTCWGSCSRKGNLNFNYRIMFLSESVQDYIVAHELCHLKELNHSRRFWRLVEDMVPDYASARSELKKTGMHI